MSTIPNVFDFVTTSNRVRQTYFGGFVDIYGGNLILRPNSNLFITGGDTSMNGNLSIYGNTTIGSNLSINGNINLSNRLIGNSDVSLNRNLFLGGDASLNGRLFVGNDISLNGNLVTNGDVYVGQLTDASLATLTTYSYDVSNTATFTNITTYINKSTGLGTTTGVDKIIKVSANGQFMIIADALNDKLAVSYDYGNTWNVKSTSDNYYHCAISATGQYMVACSDPGYVYVSSNFGFSFTKISVFGLSSSQTWTSVAISANGQYITAVMDTNNESGFAYISRDYGQTWTTRTQLSGSTLKCGRCAMSSDGKYQIVSIANTGTNYYLSSNYGSSFESKTFTLSIGGAISGPTTKWWDIAVSSSGKYMLISAHSTNTGCYYSKDYGLTWAQVGGIAIDPAYNYNSVAMSANGQYMMFAPSNSGATALYVQNNSPGTTGSTVATYLSSDNISGASFASCAISADGEYFVAISSTTSSSNVYIVQPVKTTLTNRYSYRSNPIKLLNIQGSVNPISLLDNSVMFSNQPAILLSSFGQAWSQLDGFSMMSAENIFTSAIGQYILINSANYGTGQLSLSNNYASTFTYFSPSNLYQSWSDYVCSANGQYQTAIIDGGFTITTPYASVIADNSFNSGNVYISNDFGATFRPSVVRANTPMAWTSVSVSANGQYQTGTVNGSVLNNGGIYISSNYGVSWTQIVPVGTNTLTNWAEISISATGQFQTALVSGGFIYRSTDFGITWNPVTSVGTNNWSFVSISATGQYQTAVVNGGFLYNSTNYGATWSANTNTGSKTWVSCSMVANAQYQLAVEGLVLTGGIATSGGQIWYSNNYGVTWSSGGATQSPFTGVTSSSNGQFSYAVTSAGGIFVNALGSPSTVPVVSASQTVNGTLSVGGNSTMSGTLAVAGVSTLNSTLAVTGASTLNNTLTVAGASTFNGGVTLNPPTLNILPAGMIMAWVSSNAPTGWLICNGGSYSTTGTYANLFAVIQYTFGGSGSSFNVPNYQGAFLRGTGEQIKTYNSTPITYTGPAVNNTGQSHATQQHTHAASQAAHNHTFTGTAQDLYGEANSENGKVASGAGNAESGRQWNHAGTISNATPAITVSNSETTGNAITDTNETRPFNFGVYWVIKF